MIKIKQIMKRLLFFFHKIIVNLSVFRLLSDETYLKINYRLRTGKRLNLQEPETYNEKLQWLKLNDRQSIYKQLVDKYEVRKYISKKIGEEYLIPLLGVYNSYEEIEFNSLPKQFVLKPNHTSGQLYICKDKSNINHNKLKREVNKWLKTKYYWVHREWPYKNIKPKIVCEKYMVDETGTQLNDYKIFCFNGEPKFIQVDFDRYTDHRRNIYDIDWNFLDVSTARRSPSDKSVKIPRPSRLSEMLDIAKKLSKDYPHVRVDLYYIDGEIYFGELTFYHGSGYHEFRPKGFANDVAKWLKIPS